MVVTDVLVIGGGIAGASIGYRLAQHCKAIVLEAEDQPGYHSTGRSAALYTATYGHPVIRALTLASRDFMASPPSELAAGSLLGPRGALWIARGDQKSQLADFLAEVAVIDPTVRACTPDEAVRLCPVLRPDYVVAAALEPHAADIDVHGLHQTYLRGFKARGGRIDTDARVVAIRKVRHSWEIETARERYQCRTLVNAAGAWADEIARLADVRPVGLVPKRRTAITFDVPQDCDIRPWPCVLDVEEQFYIKPEAGRLLGSPADETPSPPCDAQPEDIDIAIAADRIETATTLQIRKIGAKWAGLRTFASDKVPVVGMDPDADGFFWLAGQGGYGIMTSPALSEVAAAMVTETSLPASVAAYGIDVGSLAPARFRS